jgi:hypothetical protein
MCNLSTRLVLTGGLLVPFPRRAITLASYEAA